MLKKNADHDDCLKELARIKKRKSGKPEELYGAARMAFKVPSHLEPIFREWFDRNIDRIRIDKTSGKRAVVVSLAPKPGRPAGYVPPRVSVADEAAALEAEYHRRGILEFVMPNGKKFGDQTDEDLAAFGGWFGAMRKKLKPGQKVREQFGDSDASAAYEAIFGKTGLAPADLRKAA